MCVIWSVTEFADNVNDLFVVLCYLTFFLVAFRSFHFLLLLLLFCRFCLFFPLLCKIYKTKAKWNDKVSRIINKHNEIRSKYQWKIKSLHLDSLFVLSSLFFRCCICCYFCCCCHLLDGRCWREVHFSCVFDLTITQQRPDVAVAMQTYKVTRLLNFFSRFFFHSFISVFYRTLLHQFQQFSIR